MNAQHQNFEQQEPTQLDDFIEQFEPILKHITPHRFLWCFTVVCAFVAWNRGLMLLYGLVAFLLAVLIVSHIFRLLNLRGLSLSAEFITEDGLVDVNNDEVMTGEPIGFQLNTYSRFTKHFLQVRLPIYKVMIGNETHCQKVTESQLFILNCKGEEEFINELDLGRGVYRIQSASVSCAYPLGLLTTNKDFDVSTSTLNQSNESNDNSDAVNVYVLPHSFDIQSMPLYSANSNGHDELASLRRGGHDEFMDIRPYRRGDAFKTVHWGASAKQASRGQEWLVKEYATYDMPKMIIILNQFDLHGSHGVGNSTSAIDAMISSALAVGEYFARIGYEVGLFGYDGFSETMADFWQININTSMQKDKFRKLAEIDGLQGAYSTQSMKGGSYEEALQMILSHEPNANVIMSFYANPPSMMGAGISTLMVDKTQYQVVINRQSSHNQSSHNQSSQSQSYKNQSYKKHSQLVHEYKLNPDDMMETWQTTFNRL